MKKRILHIALIFGLTVLLSGNFLFAQQINSNEEKNKSTEKTLLEDKQENKFKDTINPTSVDKKQNGKKAKFIDNDGDGINDSRCNGFGMMKGKGAGVGCGQCKGKRNGKK